MIFIMHGFHCVKCGDDNSTNGAYTKGSIPTIFKELLRISVSVNKGYMTRNRIRKRKGVVNLLKPNDIYIYIYIYIYVVP